MWCEEAQLAAAAAAVAAASEQGSRSLSSVPELMRHLRLGLQQELNNSKGIINRQVKRLEVHGVHGVWGGSGRPCMPHEPETAAHKSSSLCTYIARLSSLQGSCRG